MGKFGPKIAPGEWRVGSFFTYSEDSDVISKFPDGSDRLICRVTSREMGLSQNQENAKAIAAVPELLEVYKAACEIRAMLEDDTFTLRLFVDHPLWWGLKELEARHGN